MHRISINSSGDRNSTELVVSVSVVISDVVHLKKLSLMDTVEETIRTLCKEQNFTYEPGALSLQWDAKVSPGLKRSLGTLYVTEDNKFEIKDACQLKLVISPTRIVEKLKAALKTQEGILTALQQISSYSSDLEFLRQYEQQQVLVYVLRIAGESCALSLEQNVHSIKTIKNAVRSNFLQGVPVEVTNKIFNIITSEEKLPREVVLATLKCSSEILTKKIWKISREEKIKLIYDVVPFIRMKDDKDIQEKALAVINNIVLNCRSSKEFRVLLHIIASQEMRDNIRDNILNVTLNTGMKHELYIYQSIMMGIYWDNYKTTVNDRNDTFRKLKAYSNDYHCHELDDEEGLESRRRTDSIVDDSGNEKRKTMWENMEIKKFVQNAFRRSRSLSRRSIRTKSDPDVSSNIPEQPIGKNAQEETRKSTMTRSTSFKEKLSGFLQQRADMTAKEESQSDSLSLNDENEFEYSKDVQFQFYGGVKVIHFPEKEKVVYDSPKRHSREKKRKDPASVNAKPPIARKSATEADQPSKDSSSGKVKTKEKKVEKSGNSQKSETLVKEDKVVLRPTEEISGLTLQNIIYLYNKERRQFKRCCNIERMHGESFFKISEELTKILCYILEVREKPKRESRDFGIYIPLAFISQSFMEELFCESVTLFRKTWTEMRGRVVDDYPKVLDTVQRQLQKALHAQPATVDQFKSFLVPYIAIAEIRKTENEQKIKKDLENKQVFMELKEVYKLEAIECIKRQRVGFMITGTKFPRYSRQTKKFGNKKFCVKLSRGKDVLVFGNWDHENDRFESGEERSSIREIKEIVTGKKCCHYKAFQSNLTTERDMFFRGKQRTEVIEFALSINLDSDKSIDVFAPNQETLDCWADGINILLGKGMDSSTYNLEVKEYLDIALRLQIMEVEGLKIPDTPPPVPQEPDNYDFCTP